MHDFFAYMDRTKLIRRWGLMRNTESETLSEHLYQTAILAHALAMIENERFGGKLDAGHIALVALYHDASEIITGDLPTPIKYYNEEIRSSYKKIEEETTQMLISRLPDFLRDGYRDIITGASLTDHEKSIIKAADTLSAYIKCLRERAAGNRDFASAERSTEAKLRAMELPSLKYFMNEFLDSFDLTIDDMR